METLQDACAFSEIACAFRCPKLVPSWHEGIAGSRFLSGQYMSRRQHTQTIKDIGRDNPLRSVFPGTSLLCGLCRLPRAPCPYLRQLCTSLRRNSAWGAAHLYLCPFDGLTTAVTFLRIRAVSVCVVCAAVKCSDV